MFALLPLLLGCGASDPSGFVPPPAPVPVVEHAAVAPDELPDLSLYLADLPIVDQDGKTDTYGRYAGHPVIAGMFYATCTHTCPLLIQQIQRFEDSLPPDLHEDVRVLMVSFAQDDPATLMDVVERHGLDTRRWTLARTDPERVRELAMLLDVTYRRNPDEGFNHTSGFTVIDGQGVIQAQIPDMNAATDPLLAALHRLAAAPSAQAPTP